MSLLALWVAGCSTADNNQLQNANKLVEEIYRLGDHDSFAAAEHLADSFYYNAPYQGTQLNFLRHKCMSIRYYRIGDKRLGQIFNDSVIAGMLASGAYKQYPKEYHQALGAKAMYFFWQDQYDSAFAYYTKTYIAYSDDTSERFELGNISHQLGLTLYRQKKYDLAATYFKRAFEEVKLSHLHNFNSYNKSQELLDNVGLAYYKYREYDSAMLYYRRALAFVRSEGQAYKTVKYERTQTEIAEGVILGNMAKIFMHLKQADTAEAYLLKSIAINSQKGHDLGDANTSYMQLAELYLTTGQHEKAKATAAEVKAYMDSQPVSGDIMLRWYKMMFKADSAVGSYQSAVAHVSRYELLKDSLDAANASLNNTDYVQLLTVTQKDYQNQLLRKDNQLKLLYLVIAISLIVVSFIGMYLIYNSYRKSAKNVRLLTELNAQINEQKIAIEQTAEKLQVLNAEKDRILRIVAHDLRNPIGGITMITDYLLEEEKDFEKAESLTLVREACGSLLSLTDELLQVNGNAHTNDGATNERFLVNDLIKRVTGLLQHKAREKQQTIASQMTQEEVAIHGNKEQLFRLLSNLVTNAIKFSSGGSEIRVSAIVDNGWVTISVADKGIGIPPDLQATIFDVYTIASRPGTAGERSFGLGLSICRQIAEAHNGRIWVTSDGSTGSTFYLQLPVAG